MSNYCVYLEIILYNYVNTYIRCMYKPQYHPIFASASIMFIFSHLW
jgi:hypothetical protein